MEPRIGYLAQEPELDDAKNVRANVMDGVADKQAILDRYNELMMNYSDETADEGAQLQDQIDAEGLWDLDSKVEMAMDALRCPPGDAEVGPLSGGERRRVALCRLYCFPSLIFCCSMSQPIISMRKLYAWLEKHLREFKGAVMIVTHDRYFLDNVTGWILELDRGTGIPYEGNYSAYLEKKKEAAGSGRPRRRCAYSPTRPRARMDGHQPASARQAKSKARINAFHELLERNENRRPTDQQISIPVAERLGNVVIEAESVCKGFGDKQLIEGLNFKLPAGGIVGIIGPNGAGKSTLFQNDHWSGKTRQR